MKILSRTPSLSMVVSYFIFLLSVIILSSANYRYFIEDMNDSLYVRLSALSLVLFVLSIILLLVRRETRLNIFLTIFSLVIGVYIVEIFLQFLYFGSINIQQKEHTPNFDNRSIYQVVEEFKKDSINVVPRVAPMTFLSTNGVIGVNTFSALIPLGGISQKKTILCNETGKYVFYDSDKHGFNNSNNVWNNSDKGWVLVGDSFTHGACVEPAHNIAGRLNNQLDNKVVNLGYSGNGPILNLASLIEYANTIKPEKVFWFYCEGNDLTDLEKELESSLIVQYLQDGFSQGLIKKQVKIDKALISHVELGQFLNQEKKIKKKQNFLKTGVNDIKRILRLYNIREKLNLRSYFSTVPEEFQSVIERAKSVVSSWGGELYFVYLPTYLRYSSLVENHDAYNHKSEIAKIVKDANIPVIDMHEEVFAKHDDPLSLFPFRLNGHYTPEGYKLISNSVLNFITNNEL